MSKTTRADGYSMTQTQKSVFLFPEDVDALFATLKERFPDVRLMDNFMRALIFLDWPGEADDPPPPEVVQGIPIPYLEKAADTPHWSVLIWRQPPGWSPIWGKPTKFSKNSKWDVLLASHAADDCEKRSFVDAVWRIWGKGATNLWIRGTGFVGLPEDPPEMREGAEKIPLFAGFHAVRYAREIGLAAKILLAAK